MMPAIDNTCHDSSFFPPDPFLSALRWGSEACFVADPFTREATAALASDVPHPLHTAVGVPPEPWNPFAGLQVLAESFPERLAGAESRFPAAVGVALAAIEEA